MVWSCPECNEETFVAEGGIDTSYLCRHTVKVTFCPHCKDLLLADDLRDFSDLFEYSKSDGRYWLENDYGYSTHVACDACVSKIRDDIEQKRFEQHQRWMEIDEALLRDR